MVSPEMGEVVYGCESWWAAIENEDDLKEISDLDINSIWYVKALKGIDRPPTEAES